MAMITLAPLDGSLTMSKTEMGEDAEVYTYKATIPCMAVEIDFGDSLEEYPGILLVAGDVLKVSRTQPREYDVIPA